MLVPGDNGRQASQAGDRCGLGGSAHFSRGLGWQAVSGEAPPHISAVFYYVALELPRKERVPSTAMLSFE